MSNQFLIDSFAGTPGAALTSRAPQVGSSWATSSTSFIVDEAGTGIRSSSSSGAQNSNSTAMPSGINVSAITHVTLSVVHIDQGYYAYLQSRVSGSNNYFLLLVFSGPSIVQCSWYRNNVLQNTYGGAPLSAADGTVYDIRIADIQSGSSTTLTAYINGVAILSYTDTSPLTQTGETALILNTSGTSETVSTGLRWSNYSVTGIGSIVAPDNASVVLSPGNQYINPGNYLEWIHNDTYAKFSYTGNTLLMMVDPTAFRNGGISAASYPSLHWSVSGGPWQTLQIAPYTFAVQLAYGGSGYVEVVFSPGDSSDPYATPVDALHVTGWAIDNGGALTAPTGNASARPKTGMIFGDSWTAGFASGWAVGDPVGSSNYSNAKTVHQCYAVQLAKALNMEVGVVGYSGQGFVSTVNFPYTLATTFPNYNAHQARTFPSNANYCIIAEGTNGGESASQTEAAIVSIATVARTKFGASTLIVLVVPVNTTIRSSDGITPSNMFAAALATYQAANPADKKMILIDLSANNYGLGSSGSVNPVGQYTWDGIHLLTESHSIFAGQLAAAIRYSEGVAVALGTASAGGGGTNVTDSAGYRPSNPLQPMQDSAGYRVSGQKSLKD